MITRKKIYDEVLYQYSGGIAPRGNKYTDDRILTDHINQVRDTLAANILGAEYMKMQSINSLYIKQYENVPVLLNASQNIKYSVLPVSVLKLPENIGVYQVSAMQERYSAFKSMKIAWQSMIGQDIGQYLLGKTGFVPFDKQVDYININPNVSEVLMFLVPKGADLSDDDEFCSPDLEFPIIQQVLALIMPNQKPEDKSNNLVSN
jgi:hypothetical protein